MENIYDIIPELTQLEKEMLSLVEGFFAGLRPVERISPSVWSNKYRFLSSVAASEPGKYRIERTPYLRFPLDCLGNYSSYQKVVFIKGTQLGVTEAACNFVGYTIHITPAGILYVMPTSEMAEILSKTRIDTLIEACPELSKRVSAPKSRDGKNTITMKTYPGGVLRLTGANSAAGLRSSPMRNLILDEVDAYPVDTGEGNPIDLAIERTNTFEYKKKIFILSTPTVSGISAIEREFFGKLDEETGEMVGGTDQNYYYIPCPHCGEKQRLVFENLKWVSGKPQTAEYMCAYCSKMIQERQKVKFLAEKTDDYPEGAEWIPMYPDKVNDKVIGFHLNGLYSPYGWKSWETIAKQFEDSKNVPAKLKVFVNTVLAETWKERGDAPEYKNLYNRREQYPINSVPTDVCFLVAGCDVQKERLEVEVVGYCKDKRSYSIDYRVFDGDTAKSDVWNRLTEMLDERWISGHRELSIQIMAVDTGYNTQHVYNYCKKFPKNRVIPIKGMDKLGVAFSAPKSTEVTKAGKKVGRVGVYGIGVSMLKTEFYGWLRLEKDENGVPPPCYCHFPQYDEHYFRGLTAEENVRTVTRKGYVVYEWRKKYDRNEPLDCRIYARSAASIFGIDRLRPETLEAISGRTVRKVVSKVAPESEISIPTQPTNIRKRRKSTYMD